MTTPSISLRPASLVAVASTGLIGTLLAVTLSGAQAVPPRDDPLPARRLVAHTSGHDVEHPCFITPPTWNAALDGHLPRCHSSVP